MHNLPTQINVRLKKLPEGLFNHTNRVRKIGCELARIHGVSELRVDLGIASHDLARPFKDEFLLEEADRYNLDISCLERHQPMLLHGLIASLWMKFEDGILDEEVIDAVHWHTTRKKQLGTIGKIIFLSDKIDPIKIKKDPHLAYVAELSQKNIDDAILKFLDLQIKNLIRHNNIIHPASIEFRNHLVMNIS